MGMKRICVLMASVAVVAFGAAGIAQAPASEIDAHVAAARAAAGLDFRNTFINLCLAAGGPPGGGSPGGARRGAPAAPAAGAGAANAPTPAGPPAAGRGRAA